MPAEPIVAPSHSRPHAVDRQIECGEKLPPHSAGWFLLEVDH